MKVLIDTNIILDIALNRKLFVEQAAFLWRLAEQKEIIACLSNTSITDIFYIINKYAGQEKAAASSPIFWIPSSWRILTRRASGKRSLRA